jgi:ATP-dependent DNA helicase RecG
VSRRYRNRRIGEFLKELDLTEGRSTGIPKILREMAANGSPAPEFDSDDDRTSYLVRLPVHPRAKTTGQAKTGPAQSGAQSGAQSRAQSRDALLALAEEPLSANELVKKLGLKSKTGAFKRTVSDLLNDSAIEYTLSDKPTSRLQKYRLTEKGRKLLENS